MNDVRVCVRERERKKEGEKEMRMRREKKRGENLMQLTSVHVIIT